MDEFRQFVKENEDTSGRSLLQFIRARKLQSVFPNVDIALRLFMTLPITNASGERSFSKLELIKNRLRSMVGENRLNHLSLMSIENWILPASLRTSLPENQERKNSQGRIMQ